MSFLCLKGQSVASDDAMLFLTMHVRYLTIGLLVTVAKGYLAVRLLMTISLISISDMAKAS